MAFNSITYLGFLFVVVFAYWLLPARLRQELVLLASVTFYASWNVIFVWLPLVVAGVVFVCGRWIQADPRTAKKWMWIGIAGLLALLVALKYRAFLATNLSYFGVRFGNTPFSLAASIVFPTGISFYTFEAIAYLIDIRQGRVKMPAFLDLCLYFFFWPNILSGPIVRARELMPQLKFDQVFKPCFMFEGFDRIIWGLVQKNVVANVLGIWVDRGFGARSTGGLSALDGWFLAVAFGLQIYFDFAGYTNLAIGAARLLGVALPENFRQPYHAATPADFWNRWHLTLSRWIRDYLFFPINAKWNGAPLPLYLSLVGVMALVGLWHGAGWGFLVWGTMHGVYLAVYRMYESFRGNRSLPINARVSAGVWRVVTLIAITAAWVPFRATSLARAGSILCTMFSRFTGSREFSPLFYAFTVGVVLFCAVEPLIMRSLAETEEEAGAAGLSIFRIVIRPVAYLFGLTLFLLFDQNYSQFIYSQF